MGRRAGALALGLVWALTTAAAPFTVEVRPETFVDIDCPQGCAPATIRIKGECYIWEYRIVLAPAVEPRGTHHVTADWVLKDMGTPTRTRKLRDDAPAKCQDEPPPVPYSYP